MFLRALPARDGVHTFNPPFPPQYMYVGHLYVLGRQNLFDAHGGPSLHLTPQVTLSAEQRFFWRQITDGPIFNAKGDLLRADIDFFYAAITFTL
jgi:hypothetical protein